MSLQQVSVERGFESWRGVARRLLGAGVRPDEVVWREASAEQGMLPGLAGVENAPAVNSRQVVPAEFLRLAKTVTLHRDGERWPLLYRVLWRIVHGERHLLDISVDDDVHALLVMEKRVRFDRHKMTAFVRFREVQGEAGSHYVAWYRPDHLIVRATAPFFAKRFATLRWSILTPDECAHWDGEALSFTAGVPASEAPGADDLEDLWRTYYGNIFNPARIKIGAMKKEMPTRFWDLLPETQDIPDLIRDAPARVKLMVARQPRDFPGAGEFVPLSATLEDLREAACACQGCPLHRAATQTVFGEGPASADAMVIGEQPGDQEDLVGRPFVGPAGQLFVETLARVGVDRGSLYVTNTVKHFKFEPRGKRRIHSKPNSREISACMPWLMSEIEIVKPRFILCLGATAGQAMLGPEFRMTRGRGVVHRTLRFAPWLMATYHPSALLRIPDARMRQTASEQFEADLRLFGAALSGN